MIHWAIPSEPVNNNPPRAIITLIILLRLKMCLFLLRDCKTTGIKQVQAASTLFNFSFSCRSSENNFCFLPKKETVFSLTYVNTTSPLVHFPTAGNRQESSQCLKFAAHVEDFALHPVHPRLAWSWGGWSFPGWRLNPDGFWPQGNAPACSFIFFLLLWFKSLGQTYNQDFPYQEELQQEQREQNIGLACNGSVWMWDGKCKGKDTV